MSVKAKPEKQANAGAARHEGTEEFGDSLLHEHRHQNAEFEKLSPNSGLHPAEETGGSLLGAEHAADTMPAKLSPLSSSPSNPVLKAHRVMTREDVLRLEPIAREAHAESRYGHIPFSTEKFLKANRRILTGSEDALALYITYGDRIVGLLGAEVGEYFLGTGTRIATCHVLYVSGTVRNTLLGGKVGTRLLRLFADWAKSRGAEELNIHVTSGIAPERTDRLLKRLGFVPYGGNYCGRVG